MVPPDGVVVGDGAAGVDDRVRDRVLDRVVLRREAALLAQADEGEVGRRPVGIDMGEAAGDNSRPARRLPERPVCRARHIAVEALEPVPGDRGLEGLADDGAGGQHLAHVAALDEGVAPARRRVPAAASLLRQAAAVIPAAFERARHPGVERVVGALEPQHQHCGRAVARARPAHLVMVQQAQIGGIEPCLRDGAHSLRPVHEMLELDRAAVAEGRAVLKAHPGFGNDAERALGAEEEPVGARARAGARQAEAVMHARRRHRAHALGHVVDMGQHGGVMAGAARRDPAAEGGIFKALRVVAQGQAVRAELFFEMGTVHARLYARRARGAVDFQHPVHGAHVYRDRGPEAAADIGMHPAHHGRAAAEGNGRRAGFRAPVEQGRDLALVARTGHQVGRAGEVAVHDADLLVEGAPEGMHQPLPLVVRADCRERSGRREPRRGDLDLVHGREGPGLEPVHPEDRRIVRLERLHLVVGKALADLAPPPELPPRHRPVSLRRAGILACRPLA